LNFAAFQRWRTECLIAQPGLLDCGETNLYRSLASLQPALRAASPTEHIYRCDLARAWLKRYGFSDERSRQALVNRGVRHALSLIFRELAHTSAVLWIPADVYPVYAELAESAGIQPRLFVTLPKPQLPTAERAHATEYLLVANPWKPLGRFLNERECAALLEWVEASPDRRMLVDCVYDLGAAFHASTQKLLESGRAILLHSVTKGWLWPKTFGVALLPGPWPEIESRFRADSPTQEQLRLAGQLLERDTLTPVRVCDALANRKRNLMTVLPRAIIDALQIDEESNAPGCYHFVVAMSFDELLKRHGIIAIPASSFGSNWHGSILTSLSNQFSDSALERAA
jgi:hypothetical protein